MKLTIGDFLKLVVYIVSALSQLFILCWKGDQLNEIVSKIVEIHGRQYIDARIGFRRVCTRQSRCTRATGKVSLSISNAMQVPHDAR